MQGADLKSRHENGRLHVGWVFRGIKAVELSRAENFALSNHHLAPKEVILPIRAIWASQEWVNDDYSTTETSSGMLPVIIRKNNEFFAHDGHHRITDVAAEGGQNVRVNLYDFDRKLIETPLLDYNYERAQRKSEELEAILRELEEFDASSQPAFGM